MRLVATVEIREFRELATSFRVASDQAQPRSHDDPEMLDACGRLLEAADIVQSALPDTASAEALVCDVVATLSSGGPQPDELLLALTRLRTILIVLDIAIAERRARTATRWTLQSLSADPALGLEVDQNTLWPESLLINGAALSRLAEPVVQRWLAAFYVVVRGTDHTDLGTAVRAWAESRIECWLLDAPTDLALEAAFSFVAWSANDDRWVDAEEVRFTLNVLARAADSSERVRARAALFSAGSHGGWNAFHQDRFRRLAVQQLGALPPGELLGAAGLNPARWPACEEMALAAADTIAELRSGLGTGRWHHAFTTTITEPVVATAAAIAEQGRYSAAVDLLRRALGVSPGAVVSEPVLAIAGERTMLWGTRAGCSRQPLAGAGLERLSHEFEAALRRSGSQESSRHGTFDRTRADAAERSLGWYLQSTRLRPMLTEQACNARTLVPLPWLDLPVQAVMTRHVGFTGELCLSLMRPFPDRPVKKIAFWTHGIDTVEYQIEAMSAIAGDSGAVTVMRDEPVERLQEIWEDDTFDVLWLSVHGELDGDERDMSLVVADGVCMSSDEFASLGRPAAERRRLIVLDACDSGATASFGGLGGVGLVTGICGPSQAVIGHLWPTEFLQAAGFGALLAAELLLDFRSS